MTVEGVTAEFSQCLNTEEREQEIQIKQGTGE